jgi:uncharacterized protein YbaP (TraB family)
VNRLNNWKSAASTSKLKWPFWSILVLTVSAVSSVSADTSVWSVTSGSNTVYLGGTVHFLRTSDFPLPEEYEQAYQAASEIYFETDIGAMNDPSVQARMLQQLTYNDERSLKTVLNEEAYTTLSEYAASTNIPMMVLEKFKPGLLIATIQISEFQSLGFTPQGVDTYFTTRAIGDAKSLGQLETVQEQIGFIAAMGEGNESEFVLVSLRDLDKNRELMDEMVQAWRVGNNAGLAKMFVEDMKSKTPELYDSLLLQRNLKWIPQIDQMLTDGDTEFVLVGAAHLVGEDGLLEMLTNKGYEIRQL